MLIQSKKIWIADQFMAAELDIKDGKIVDVLPYGSQPADVDYESGSNIISQDVQCVEN